MSPLHATWKRSATHSHPPGHGRPKQPVGKAIGRAATGSRCANSGENGSLVQCVQRKLQQPVRTQPGLYHRKCGLPVGRPYSPAALKRRPALVEPSSPGTRTCPPTFRLPGTPRCRRKSLSLIDLSPAGIDRDIGDLRSESGASSARMGDVAERTMDLPVGGMAAMHTATDQNGLWIGDSEPSDLRSSKDVNKAASVVCHLLAINAWRRRREEVVALQETAEELSQQVDHLHIQIVVLRRLLHTENCRVEKLGAEVHQAKTQLEDAARERDAYRTEKEKLDEELEKTKADAEERAVAAENLRNELMTTKDQLETLDKQMARDREKLLKLREDKKILLDKVSTAEALAEERGLTAERAKAAVEELEARLTAQESVIETLREDNRKSSRDAKATETEKMRLEKRLRLSEDAGRALSLRAANLEMQLSDRESALRRIESAYNSQLSELTDLREQLQRQSHEEGWSSRVLQIAGSVVWVPRAILRSLSFLSTTGVQQ